MPISFQEVLKNILYYVGTSKANGPRVSKIKRAYKLDELLVDESSVADLSASMGGINAELFDTVSQGIREDLATVKDTLEIFMQSSDKDVEQLSSVVEQIEKIGDTYGMLGFGAIRQKVLEQRGEVENIISGKSEATEERVLEIASTLLEAESQLDDYIAGKSGLAGDKKEGAIPSSEYRKVLATVVEEGQKNFMDAKEAILVYAAGNEDSGSLETVVQRLEEVRGVCMMLSADRVADLISGLKEYVNIALRMHHRHPEAEEQDTLADVVTSIEYYFESLSEGRPGVDKGLQTGEQGLAILSEVVKQYAGVDAPVEEKASVSGEVDESLEMEEGDADSKQEREIEVPVIPAVASGESINVANAVVPDQYEEYEILSDDADEEIVEIFIEEAVEVLE
ncbi:MAG: hypothetical protein OEM07_02425, partial [Gammaproteobacteria bacterium]|nr:hypothetical protein [Gammaproteobacteria bacterium]